MNTAAIILFGSTSGVPANFNVAEKSPQNKGDEKENKAAQRLPKSRAAGQGQ